MWVHVKHVRWYGNLKSEKQHHEKNMELEFSRIITSTNN